MMNDIIWFEGMLVDLFDENLNVTAVTYSSGDGWCRTMWIIRPGGYNGLCSVSAIELSFGCVLALRAEYLSCEARKKRYRKRKL